MIYWKLFSMAMLSIIGHELAVRVSVPNNYRALSGDLRIVVDDILDDIETNYSASYHVQILDNKDQYGTISIMSSTVLKWDDRMDTLIATFPCGIITEGGKYLVRVVLNEQYDYSNATTTDGYDVDASLPTENISTELEVLWPRANLSTEKTEIETFSDTGVTSLVRFERTHCEPQLGSRVPQLWLNLIYCGHSPNQCVPINTTYPLQILYSEPFHTYPEFRVTHLDCALFGQAGYYSLLVTDAPKAHGAVIATTDPSQNLKVYWSNNILLSVYAKSIFPCDAHNGGIAAIFEYPNCSLPGDRVRLYGRLRADVSATLPPTTLHYITEQKISDGQHSLYFDCDNFSEKFVEYCFVYASRAINDAFSDVRMECIPTFPVNDEDAGGWGKWSEWSHCSTSCKGGTRNRYRFCDSPPPHYGAKYCQGRAMESEECGNVTNWECELYNSEGILSDKLTVKDEVGAACKCGCIVHLSKDKPQRLLAGSAKSCPSKSSWLILAEEGHVVQLHVDYVHLPCPRQRLKIYDGRHFWSVLVAQFANVRAFFQNHSLVASDAAILLELISQNDSCGGGFLSHFQQIDANVSKRSTTYGGYVSVLLENTHPARVTLSMAMAVVMVASVCMLLQYWTKYRKYRRAAAVEGEFSDDDSYSKSANVAAITTSNTTLFSEMISMRQINTNQRNESVRITNLSNSDCTIQSDKNELISEFENGDSGVTNNIIGSSQPGFDEEAEKTNGAELSNRIHPKLKTKLSSNISEETCSGSETLRRASSLSAEEHDLEMDYYDYNVHNTSHLTGSYLAMDPAYCLWIPPFAPGQWTNTETNVTSDTENSTTDVDKSYKRRSDATLMAADEIISDDDMLIEAAISPDTPMDVAKAFVVTRNAKTSGEEVPVNNSNSDDSEIKFADDDDDYAE